MLLMCAGIAGKAVRIELKSSNRDNITTTLTSDVVTAMNTGIACKAVISKADASDICCGVETASMLDPATKNSMLSPAVLNATDVQQVIIVGNKSGILTLKLRGKAECDLEDGAKNGELCIVKRRPYLCCIWCSNEYNKDYQIIAD